MRDGKRESQDALSRAMRHDNDLLSKMGFSLDGAIAHASNMFVVEGSGEQPLSLAFTLGELTQGRI